MQGFHRCFLVSPIEESIGSIKKDLTPPDSCLHSSTRCTIWNRIRHPERQCLICIGCHRERTISNPLCYVFRVVLRLSTSPGCHIEKDLTSSRYPGHPILSLFGGCPIDRFDCLICFIPEVVSEKTTGDPLHRE